MPSGFNSFQAPTNNLGYAVGGYGLILRYDDTTYVPVELISFEGRMENNTVILSWVTASELNNQGFYIEKSFDKENWFTISFMKGNGTTTELNHYSFVDKEIKSNTQFYRLKQVDYNGSYEYSKIIEINTDLLLSSFQLYQNYPNPFNPVTTITYIVPKKSFIKIILFDIKGEKLSELLNEEKDSGFYSVEINSKNLSSGVYFYIMTSSSGYYSVKKLTIIK